MLKKSSAIMVVAVFALLATSACSKQGQAIVNPSPAASTPSVAPSPTAVSTNQTIVLTDYKVGMTATTLPANTYNFTIKNSGSMAHELLVFKSDLAPSAYPLDDEGAINEDGTGVTKVSDGENIDPGDVQTRSVPLTAGKYMFVCNLPGHFKLGMYTLVTVT